MTEPKRRKLPLAGLGLISAGGVLGVTLGMPGAAYADTPTEATTSSDSREPAAAPGTAAPARPAPARSAPARPGPATTLLVARLDRAVTDGALTREQADTILAAAEAGMLNGDLVGGPGGHRGPDNDRQTGR